MPKTLIITLGTGPGVESGIARSIQVSHPDIIRFVATKESSATICKVETKLGYRLAYGEPYLVENGDDVEECWVIVDGLIRSVIEGGCQPNDIFVDFTSGTKAMSAGAVLAAIGRVCSGLVYVAGKRGPDSRVISGTERVITVAPSRIFIESQRKLLRDFFNAFQYEACSKLTQSIRGKAADRELQSECDCLENLISAYSKWDRFDHRGALHHFSQLPKGGSNRWHIDTSHSKEMVSRIAKQQERYTATSDIKARYGEEILADLLANAERRAKEGKYDDAIARLYRAVELIAQSFLSRHNIDTSNVSPDDLPQSWQASSPTNSSPLKLGQERAFFLLEALGEDVGKHYCQNLNLRNYLSKRNNSILAHGIEPMSKSAYEELNRGTHNLALIAFPQISSFEQKSRFPELELL
jgi:CRISPR-associated protein (TIGR02710 family)